MTVLETLSQLHEDLACEVCGMTFVKKPYKITHKRENIQSEHICVQRVWENVSQINILVENRKY